jgi:hypothetical protein
MVELIVAMFIIGLVLVVLIGVEISAALTVADARARQEATALGNEAIEEMRAIPWNVLAKGMDVHYLSASGGDPHVSSGHLLVDGKDVTLVVATAAADQNHAKPWPPLFDSTGSNKQVRTDPSGLATQYTIRSYVSQGIAGGATTRGLAVIVEWENSKGRTEHTTIWSEANRGAGCGLASLDTQPYMGACQAFLASSSTSGSIVTQLTASTLVGEPVFENYPLLGPTSGDWAYLLAMRTAGVAASVDSQQVTIVNAADQYGGTTVDDNDEATQTPIEGWDNGYRLESLAASNDPSLAEIPNNPTDLNIVPLSGDENERDVEQSGAPFRLWALSDYLRSSTADASTTTSCATGIPAGQPCAKATIANKNVLVGGSGYLFMEIEDTIIRLSRRTEDISNSGSNTENAWAARFSSAASTSSAVGCQTLTAEGCVSAGAERTMATLAIGTVIGGGGWSTQAVDGLVLVEKKSSCAVNTGFYESVMVQRGASQKATVPTSTRCGQIRYWSGSAYTTVAIGAAAVTPMDTPIMTFTSGEYTLTAQAHVEVDAAATATSGPADCISDACVVQADAGLITISVNYTITWSGGSYALSSVTVVNPPQATASYKAAPSA